MSRLERVIRNSTSLMASRVIGRGLAFIAVLMAARYLGADGYGMLSFALALCGIFNVVADLGFHLVIVKDVARDNSLAIPYMRRVLFIKIFLVAAAGSLIFLAAWSMGKSGQAMAVIMLIAAYFFINGFSQVAVAFLKAFEVMHFVAIGEVLMYFVLLAGFAAAIYAGLPVTAFASSYILAASAVLVFSWVVFRRAMVSRPEAMSPTRLQVHSSTLIRSAIPFAVITATNMLFFYSDSLMLGIFREQREVGLYGVAFRSALVLGFIPWAMNASLMPVLSRMYGEDSSAVGRTAGRYFRYILIAAIPIGVGGTLLARDIMPFVFGGKYSEAGPIFEILIWSLVFMFLRAPFINMFESTDRQFIVSRFFGYCVAFNVGANLLLIPRYGMMGAAVSTVITDFMIFGTLAIRGLRSHMYEFAPGTVALFVKVLACSAVMGAGCYYSLRFGVPAAFFLSVLVYLIMLAITRTLDSADFAMLRKVLGR